MNAILTQDGKTIITETSIDEAFLLYSTLRYINVHKSLYKGIISPEEIEFAGKLADELRSYLEYYEQEFIVE